MSRHCILGEDYEESCETKACHLKDLCRKLHNEKEENHH